MIGNLKQKYTNRSACEYKFDNNEFQVPAHRHPNGKGWVANTSRVHPGAFIGPDAQVYGRAKIGKNVKVYGEAEVYGHAHIHGSATISEQAAVMGDAKVYGNAVVSGASMILDGSRVHQNARIGGDITLGGNVCVRGNAKITHEARIVGKIIIYGDAVLSEVELSNLWKDDPMRIYGSSILSGEIVIHGDVSLFGNSHFHGKGKFMDSDPGSDGRYVFLQESTGYFLSDWVEEGDDTSSNVDLAVVSSSPQVPTFVCGEYTPVPLSVAKIMAN